MKFILIISCLMLFSMAYADDPCQSVSGPYGPVKCSAGITPKVFANGPVTMNGTTVIGGANITGPLNAKNVAFNRLTVTGAVNISQSTIKNATYITGSLMASNTTFGDTLTIAANKFSLNDCHTADITVQSSGTGVVSQTITLTGKTVVDGNITFKEPGGIVNAGPNVQITGKVIGGKIVKQVEKKKTVEDKVGSSAAQSQ